MPQPVVNEGRSLIMNLGLYGIIYYYVEEEEKKRKKQKRQIIHIQSRILYIYILINNKLKLKIIIIFQYNNKIIIGTTIYYFINIISEYIV